MNSNRKRLRPDISTTPNKPPSKRLAPDRSPHLPTPNLTCTPLTIIKSKRFRPKPKPIEKPLNINILPINLEKVQNENLPLLPKSAPASPFESFSKAKQSSMTPFSNSRLKPPKIFLREKTGSFFHRSFHVTGFELKDLESVHQHYNETEASPLGRTRVNYRLFRSPPKDPSPNES